MGTLTVFNYVTVDGFFAGPRGEIDWFKTIRKDDDYQAYTYGQSQSGATLIFGRTTYDMMKSYWPTPDAIKSDPGMARVVNESPKIVFSKTLSSVKDEPNWKNVTLLHDIEPADIARRKKEGGAGVTILGSGTIVQQFARLGLVDEYHLVVAPIVLGNGKPLFKNVGKLILELVQAKAFKNGIVLLTYRPA